MFNAELRSLLRQINDLCIILNSKCLNSLTVNETRLHEIIADNEASIDGYGIVLRPTAKQ